MLFRNIFACPVCKGALANESCDKCAITFQKNDITSFLCKEMYSSSEAYSSAMRVIDFWGHGWQKRLVEPEHKFMYSLDEAALKQYADQSMLQCQENKTLMSFVSGQNGALALNIGCGAGLEAAMLGSSGATVIAMDITNPAASAADSLLRTLKNEGEGVQGDARFIPLQDGSVDIVYSSGVLHHSPDISKSIAEIHRVLKPGGMAYVMLYATWSITFLQEKLLGWTGEQSWETGERKTPLTTTYSMAECKKLFTDFELVAIEKQGASLRNFAKVGRLLPTFFDKYIDKPLGATINIVVKK